MGDGAPPDARLNWICDKVCPLIKGNKGMFDKLVATEDGEIIRTFVNSEGMMRLFFIGGAKDMTVMEKLPDDKMTKKKVAFCVKSCECKFDEKKLNDMFEKCIIGDLSPALLNNFHGLLRYVYLPIINNPAKSKAWPEPAVKLFADKYYKTLADVFVAIGQTQGKTLLFLPPSEMLGGGGSSSRGNGADKSDEKRVHILESAVVLWTERINNALSRAPESVFANGSHPGPQTGIDFWTIKYTDLSDILEQLKGPQVVKVMKVLEIIRSPYYESFRKLHKELEVAAAEAKDNCLYLQSLKPHFDVLGQAEFEVCAEVFKPIMHVLLLIWKHSKFYNTPPALALIMRMTCNDVIEKSRDFLGGTGELFGAEPKESVEKLVQVLDIIKQLKYDYYIYYGLSKSQCDTNPWMADRGNMFKRLDLFIARCEDLLHLCRTAQQFEKMATVVIGGNSGAALTNDIDHVAKAFDKAFDKFKTCPYDVLDVEEEKFEADMTQFSLIVKELETKIAKVLSLGFEDCGTVGAGFKLVESFGEILERDFVQSDLEMKHLELIRVYAEELKEVQELFTRDRHGAASKGKFFERDGPPLYTNMPPVSGALAWVQGLLRRLDEPYRSLSTVLRLMEETDEVKDVRRMYDSITSSLRQTHDERYSSIPAKFCMESRWRPERGRMSSGR